MKTQNQIIQETYTSMILEAVHPSEAKLREEECKRAGKTHTEMAAEHNKYADWMDKVGQKGLAYNSRHYAKQHLELAELEKNK